MGQWWPAAGSGALSVIVCAQEDLLKEVTIIFITSTIVWPQVKQQGGNTAPPKAENLIKDLLSKAPPIRTRPIFPHGQSLPSGSFRKALILISQREDRMQTTVTEIKLITWTIALSNSMKLWAMLCRPPKTDGSWWRVLTKHGPQEKGMANHFSVLALRIP